MNVRIGPWIDNYRAFFGDISNPRATAYESVIQANVSNYRQGELDAAVSSLCSSWRGEGKPGVKEIIDRIYGLRGGIPGDHSRRRRQEEHYARMRKIEKAETDAEIWDIICEPSTVDDCQALENYAARIFPDFKRPRFEFVSRISEVADFLQT